MTSWRKGIKRHSINQDMQALVVFFYVGERF